MLLGVFLHTSFLYAGGKPWLVKDDDSSDLLLAVNESIHFFRIPCFFILSGFFALMLIKKQGRAGFVKSRMRRLALPMVSTAILFNSAQTYLIHSARTHDWNPADFAASRAYALFWESGEWVGHLWFLVYALAYSVAAAFLWAAWKTFSPRVDGVRARPRGTAPFLYRTLVRKGWFLVLLPIAHVAIYVGAAFVPLLYWNWGGLSGYGFLHFFPYFLFGLLVFLDRRLLEAFHRIRWWHLLAIPLLLSFANLMRAWFPSDLGRLASHYVDSFLVWLCCIATFAAFRFLLNRKQRIFAYLSEASYSIYLFHHVCVVGLGLLLVNEDWNVLVKFAVVVGISLGASLAAHHFLVLRVRVLRMLFMGK
jgi:glucan biosynthesis protein C